MNHRYTWLICSVVFTIAAIGLWIAIVAGALTFVPGGLGGTEVVLYMLCLTTGMGDSEAVAATLLIRLATLWYAVALGLAALLWFEVAVPSVKIQSSGE
jgi:uncharacterized protein (TIRG00374 family)